jgi:hypothetical protein
VHRREEVDAEGEEQEEGEEEVEATGGHVFSNQ